MNINIISYLAGILIMASVAVPIFDTIANDIKEEKIIYKEFTKNLCIDEQELIKDVFYRDNQTIIISSSGCPVITTTIQNWQNLDDNTKEIITQRLLIVGYTEGSEIEQWE